MTQPFDHDQPRSGEVRGYCPMGCGQTLFLGVGGYVTCSYLQCPLPDAASILLHDQQTDHIMQVHGRAVGPHATGSGTQLKETSTIMHPLRERINSDLFRCPVTYAQLDIKRPGVYVIKEGQPPQRIGDVDE